MNIRDAYNAKAIAVRHTEAASNKQAYLGAGLFPNKKKTGLDLKWIKTHSGLPVSLAPSNFDALPEVLNEGRRVINNIQRVATLFLTKTVFSILLTLITILLN